MNFKPDLTPKQMIELGVFTNTYFTPKEAKHIPPAWKYTPGNFKKPDKMANAFKVTSGLSREEWQAKGWIHKDDPLGWFQWYCRYFLGRRHEDDERQIKRQLAFTRHHQQLINKGRADILSRRVQRQACLQWAYDPLPDFAFKPEETTFKKIKRILDENRFE